MHLTIKDTRKNDELLLMISLHQLWRLPQIFNFPASQKGQQMIDQELLFQN